MKEGGRGLAGGRLVVGLAGKMCSGKNVAADILAEKGFAVLDADEAAHHALEECREEVLAAFEALALERGICIKNADGGVNRRELGRLLFSDKALLARHEAILFPKIDRIIFDFIEGASGNVVINAPLLFKSGAAGLCGFVILVTAPAPIRLLRARRRDRLSFLQIMRRFSSQRGLFSQKALKNADIVRVRNWRGKDSLKRKLDDALRKKGAAE